MGCPFPSRNGSEHPVANIMPQQSPAFQVHDLPGS
jgi:hypothetical protein